MSKVYKEIVSNSGSAYDNVKKVFRNVCMDKSFDKDAVLFTKDLEDLYVIPTAILTNSCINGTESFLDKIEDSYDKVVEYPYEISIESKYEDNTNEDEDNTIISEYVKVVDGESKQKRSLFFKKLPPEDSILTYVSFKLVGTYKMYKENYIDLNTDEVNVTIFKKGNLFNENLLDGLNVYPLKEFIEKSYGKEYLKSIKKDYDISIDLTLLNIIPDSLGDRKTRTEQEDYYMINKGLGIKIPDREEPILISDEITYIDREYDILANITQYLTVDTFETKIALHKIDENNGYRLIENINVYSDVSNVKNNKLSEEELLKESINISVDLYQKIYSRLNDYDSIKFKRLSEILSERGGFATYMYGYILEEGL